MPNNELNLADFQKIIFLNNIEESSEISDINNIFKYGENSNEKFDFAVFFTEQDKSNISNLDNAEQYPNKIINIWNKGQRLNRFIGIDKLNNQIITEEKTYKLLFSPNDGLISVIDQKKVLSIIPSINILNTNASLELREVNSETQVLDPIPENLCSKIKWFASNSDIELNPPNGDDNTLCKIKDSVKTYGKFTLNATLNGQPVQFSRTPDMLSTYTLTIKWNSLNAQTPNRPFSCHSSHIFSTDITATLTGYQTAKTPTIQLIKDAVCPSSNEIKVRIIEADKEYAIPGWPTGNRTSDYTGYLQLTDWSLTPGTYNITTIAPAIENGNGSLQITVTEITPRLLIGLNSSSLNVYNASTNNTISKTYDGTALYATVSIKDPTNHLQSINRQFNGTITYWEDGKNTIHEVQYVGTPIQLTGVSITNIDGNKNSIKLHVQFTPNRNDNTYIYYGAIQNAEITLQLNQKPSTLTLTGVTTTYDGTNYYIKGKPSVTGTIYYKEYIGNNIPNKEELKRYGFKVLNAVANRYCDLSDIHPISVCTDHIAAYLDPDDDSYDDSSVVTADIVINKTNTSLVFNGSSDVYDGNRHGSFDVKITASPAVDGKLYYATSENLFTKFSSVNTSDYNGTTATVRVNLPFDMQQTNVGDYRIYVKFIPDNTQDYNESTIVEGTFSITQAKPTLTISNYSNYYSALKQGFIRVTPSVSGEVYYGLSQNNQPYHIHASRNTSVDLVDENIQVKHVNTSSPQIIYIHLEPDDTNTYNNSNIYTATIEIKKSKPTLTLSSSSIQYSNTANKAYATVIGDGTDEITGTIYYVAGDVITSQTQAHQKKYNNATITLDNVSQTDAGSIKLTAQFVPSNAVRDGVKLSDDYDSSDAKSITITVTKAPQSAPTASGDTQKYPYSHSVKATASGGGQQGSLIWVDVDNNDTETSNEIPPNSAPTSKNIRAYWSGNNNYEPSPKSNTVTIEITTGNPIIPDAEAFKFNGSKLIYDGDTKELIDTHIRPHNGKTYWYVSTSSTQPTWSTAANSGWSLGIPSKIEPGTYYVWYYVELNTDLYNNPGTFYNTVTEVTETSAAPGGDGYETGHKTIYKSTPTIKINGSTVTNTNSPVTGYTGTYNGNYQGSFTLTPSVKGYGDYDKGGGDTPGYINTTNANQTVTVDVGNELCIKYAGTHPIYVYFHPSDTVHYNYVNLQVNIIINPKKLDTPVLTAVNATWAGIDGGAIATVTVKPYKVYMNGAQREPDIEFYYRLETSSSMKTSSSAPRLNKPGWMRVKAIYKNSTNGVVDNNWVSSDESDLVEVYMYKREVTITPPEFTTSTLTYDRVEYSLIKRGTGSCTDGGIMFYYVSKNNATTPTWDAASATAPNSSSGWKTNGAGGVDAGTYYVWWVCYVSNTTYNIGNNINTVNRISGSKNINRVNPYLNQAPEPVGTILYDGKTHSLLQGGAVQHSSTNIINVPGRFTYRTESAVGTYTNLYWSWLPTGDSINNYNSISGTVNGTVNIAELSLSLKLDGGNSENGETYLPAEMVKGRISVTPGGTRIFKTWTVDDEAFAGIAHVDADYITIYPRRTGNTAPNIDNQTYGNKKVVVTASGDNITKTINAYIKDIVAFYKYKDGGTDEWQYRLQNTSYNKTYNNSNPGVTPLSIFQFTHYDFPAATESNGLNTDITSKQVVKIGIGTKCTAITPGSVCGHTSLEEVIIASSVVAVGTNDTYASPVGYKGLPSDFTSNGGAFQGCPNLKRVVFKWNSQDYGNRDFRYICGNSFINTYYDTDGTYKTRLKEIYFEDALPPQCSGAFKNFIINYNVTVYFRESAYAHATRANYQQSNGWIEIAQARPNNIKVFSGEIY